MGFPPCVLINKTKERRNKMDNETKELFRTWLIDGGQGTCNATPESINTYIGDLERVETRLGITLDEEFNKDDLVELHTSFDDSIPENTIAGSNLDRMQIPLGTTTAGSYRGSINHYKRFCELNYS